MTKKTVLKVNVHCGKCKTQVLRAVAKLSGTVTVTGDVDPVCLVKKVRKTGKIVEIASVGPPVPQEEPDSPSKTTLCVVGKPLPPCDCQLVPVSYYPSHGYGICSIL